MQFYQAQPKFLLRTPLLAFNGVLKEILSATDPETQTALLYRIYRDKFVNDALFLASPVLHGQLEKRMAGNASSAADDEQLIVSLTRYLLRMTTRCTPFGLFAGCTLGEWGEKNDIRLSLPDRFVRHTRPDMVYLCQLSQNISQLPGIREWLQYFPNSSHYVFGSNIRFADYYYRHNNRFHRLASAEYSEYLERILNRCANGALLDELAEEIMDDEIGKEDAREFLYELIEGKLLVSELDGNTTGPEMLDRTITVLQRLKHSAVALDMAGQLERLRDALLQIDSNHVAGNTPNPYERVIDILNTIEHSVDANNLLQVDMLKPAETCSLDSKVLHSIQRGLTVINRLTPKMTSARLDGFKKAFEARYETKSIPLLEALDVESGIGYHATGQSDINPLIDDLPLGTAEGDATKTLSGLSAFWLQKLIQAHKDGRYEINLTDDDLEQISKPEWDDLIESFSTMVSIVRVPSGPDALPLIYMNNASGPSTRILGRFTHLDPKLNEWVRAIAGADDALNEDTVTAEIVHLPESRTGNILMRTHVRDYEIPYLAHSTVTTERQIKLQDIYLQLVNNELILFSKTLGKRIIPAMSNAHNYTNNTLPVYQFLCDVQYQNKRAILQQNWGSLESEFKFLPRLTYENIILSRATWQLHWTDLSTLPQLSRETNPVPKILEWKNNLNLPDRVLVVRGDNELFVDFNNYLCVKSFLHEIKKGASLRVAEFLFDDQNQVITDTQGKAYANEIVVVFNKEKPNPKTQKPMPVSATALCRSFPPGSEWIYFKLYCGIRTADEILHARILPLTQLFARNGWVDRWFFIRYSDPDKHIRLRFHLSDQRHLGAVISMVYQALEQPLQQRLIWKLQTDTYEREVERYGVHTMEISESLFHCDSLHTLLFLQQSGDFQEAARWYYGLLAADSLLNCFGMSLEAKIAFTEMMKDAFEAEFKVKDNVRLRKLVNDKFRNHRQQIIPLLDSSDEDSFGDLYRLMASRQSDTQSIADNILKIYKEQRINPERYMPSYIHMLFNRLFTSGQRTYELVLYELLYGYYQYKFHVAKKRPSVQQVESVVERH